MLRLLMCFDKPEVHVGSARDLSEDVGSVGVLELVRLRNGLADKLAIEGDGPGQLRDVFLAAGYVEWIVRQAGVLRCNADSASRDAAELDDALAMVSTYTPISV